ncbi:MAG: hypothetical protein ACK53Y_01980, partial [bacterium]
GGRNGRSTRTQRRTAAPLSSRRPGAAASAARSHTGKPPPRKRARPARSAFSRATCTVTSSPSMPTRDAAAATLAPNKATPVTSRMPTSTRAARATPHGG